MEKWVLEVGRRTIYCLRTAAVSWSTRGGIGSVVPVSAVLLVEADLTQAAAAEGGHAAAMAKVGGRESRGIIERETAKASARALPSVEKASVAFLLASARTTRLLLRLLGSDRGRIPFTNDP